MQNLYLEIYKTLLRKKLKKTKTHKEITFMSWKVWRFQLSLNLFNAIPIKIQTGILVEPHKLILNVYANARVKNSQNLLFTGYQDV